MKEKKNIFSLPKGIDGPFTQQYHEAVALASTDTNSACQLLLDIILKECPLQQIQPDISSADTEDPWIVKEVSVYMLAKIQVEKSLIAEAQNTLVSIRPLFSNISKVRTAKIIRNFIDLLAMLPNAEKLQEQLCLETIRWAKEEKRVFLRHRIETRLAFLYYKLGRYTPSLQIVKDVLHEVKKLEDKSLLVELYYIKACNCLAIKDVSRCKAALTLGRNLAFSIHCPPLMQADLDVLSGEVNLEEDYPASAFAYFVEAFDAYDAAGERDKATVVLKYALLSKITDKTADDVFSLISQKKYLPYSGRNTDSLISLAKSYKSRDFASFEDAENKLLSDNPTSTMIAYIMKLYQFMFEQDVLKVLKPYSRVEVSYIADQIKMPINKVQDKLSQMISDKQLDGSLDQSSGILSLFATEKIPSAFSDSIEIYRNLSQTVDILATKAQTII